MQSCYPWNNPFEYFNYFRNIFIFPEPQILFQATLRFKRQDKWWCFIQICHTVKQYYVFVISNYFQNLGFLQMQIFYSHLFDLIVLKLFWGPLILRFLKPWIPWQKFVYYKIRAMIYTINPYGKTKWSPNRSILG